MTDPTLTSAIRAIDERIKKLKTAREILAGLNGGETPLFDQVETTPKKMTNRQAIIAILKENENRAMMAVQIYDILKAKKREIKQSVVRSTLSVGKRDGIFKKTGRGWSLAEDKKE